jgi:hypothetical protein
MREPGFWKKALPPIVPKQRPGSCISLQNDIIAPCRHCGEIIASSTPMVTDGQTFWLKVKDLCNTISLPFHQ